MLRRKKVGIIVGPGGCTGAITAGMFAELVASLRRMGVTPTYIQGISVGGLVACGFTELRDMIVAWLRLGKKGITALFNYFEIPFRLFGTSWFSNRGLVQLAARVDPRKLFEVSEKTEIEIAVRDEGSRRSPEARRTRFISSRNKRLYAQAHLWREFLEAGCCIPGILPSKNIVGRVYSDALYPSFGRVFRKGCDVVFFCSSDQPQSEKPLSRFMQWLVGRWFMRIREPFNNTYEGLIEHKLRVLLSSKKHPGIKLFALDAPVELLDRIQDILTPLTPENFARAERAIVIVTPNKAIDRLNLIYFTEQSIREGIHHGRDRMRETLKALGCTARPPET